MIKKVLQIVGTLILVFGPIFVTWYLEQREPDVRYTLSEGIPASFITSGATAPETIQQLEVRNIGKAKAERIVVKIAQQWTSYEIQKYAASDTVEIFDQQQPIEVIYPELPPQASFKVVIQTPNGVGPDELAVSHSSGIARDALAETGGLNWGSLLLGVYTTGMIVFAGWALLSLIPDAVSSRIERQPPLQILEYEKPWYYTERRWRTFHRGIIERKVDRDSLYGTGVDGGMAYTCLSADKPEGVPDQEWEEITRLAVRQLETMCSTAIRRLLVTDTLSFLRLEKPPLFPEERWEGLRTQANKAFVSNSTRLCMDFRDAYQALGELGEKPEGVSDVAWSQVREYYQNAYFGRLEHELIVSRDPSAFLEQQDLSVLDDESARRLLGRVSEQTKYEVYAGLTEAVLRGQPLGDERPDNITPGEWRRLHRWQEAIARTTKAGNDAQLRSDLLYRLVKREPLGDEKPETLPDSQWDEFKRLEQTIADFLDVEQRERELQEGFGALAVERAEVAQLKERILRQLGIVNDVLRDPQAIDRIEPYDDSFAPGNLANLRMVARILHTQDQEPS